MRIVRVAVTLALVTALAGCDPLIRLPNRGSIHYTLNLKRHNDAGFFITHDDPPEEIGAYEPIGMHTSVVWPKLTIVEGKFSREQGRFIPKHVHVEPVLMDTVMDNVVHKTRTLGADALYNLHIKTVSDVYIVGKVEHEILGVEVTGFAVKRLK